MRINLAESGKAGNQSLLSGRTIAVAWLLFSGFMVLLVFMQNLSTGTPTDWTDALGGRLLHGLIWGLLTPLVFWLARRFDLTENRYRLLYLVVHAVASYCLTLIYRLVYAGMMHVVVEPGSGFKLAAVVLNANVWVPIYWMLLCIAYAVQYQERYREGQLRAAHLETQLVQAQLQALKMQLQPHFLFNSMNAISALMTEDVKTARRMLAKLSQFLRLVLEGTEEQEVTLEKEMQLTRLYLEIEQIRFPDRLAVHYDLAPETLGALLPTLLLQPVVENAVRHGIAPRAGSGQLALTARRQADRLVLEVKDDGRGANNSMAWGIGLRNLQNRLAALYGSQYTFEVETAPNEGFCLHISLPYRQPALAS